MKMFVIESTGLSKKKLNWEYGIISNELGIMKKEEIEMMRRIFIRQVKKENGKLRIMIQSDKTLTNKPNEVRMGKGKGSVKRYYSPIQKGKIIIEFAHIKEKILKKGLLLLKKRLNFDISLIKKDDKN